VKSLESSSPEDIAIGVLRKKIADLNPQVDTQLEEAEKAVADLVDRLEEQRALSRAVQTLGGAVDAQIDDAPWRRVEPVDRARRVQRELEMLKVARERSDPERGLRRERRASSRRRSVRADDAPDVEELAVEFARAHSRDFHVKDLAVHILTSDTTRYRDEKTAQASLYHHLGKSDQFERIGRGRFRLTDSTPSAAREGDDRDGGVVSPD